MFIQYIFLDNHAVYSFFSLALNQTLDYAKYSRDVFIVLEILLFYIKSASYIFIINLRER